MNIFYLHHDPCIAPSYLYDKHKVKMILETAQMLCTAHQHYAEQEGYDNSYIPYQKAYYNHPSTKWARESYANYKWLWEYFVNINIVYHGRYGKIHKSWLVCKDTISQPPVGIAVKHFTQPPQCMPDEYKTECSVQAYWNYYINDKKKIARADEDTWVFRPREIEQLNVNSYEA